MGPEKYHNQHQEEEEEDEYYNGSNTNRRGLQFSDICDSNLLPVTEGVLQEFGTFTCTCDTSSISIRCVAPQNCTASADDTGCEGKELCLASQYDYFFDKNEMSKGKVKFDHANSIETFFGSDYDNRKIKVTYGDNNELSSCEVTFSLKGVDYPCNKCDICGADNDSATIHCDNIQQNATSVECMKIEEVPDFLLDHCIEGGPPIPRKVATPTNVGEGLSSSIASFLCSIFVVATTFVAIM